MRQKRNIKRWVGTLVLLAIVAAILYGWCSYRDFELNVLDVIFFVVGFLSFIWMVVWMNYFNTNKQPLIIPWAPILLVPLLLIIGTGFGVISNSEEIDGFILFYGGYMIMLPIISVIELITGFNIYYFRK